MTNPSTPSAPSAALLLMPNSESLVYSRTSPGTTQCPEFFSISTLYPNSIAALTFSTVFQKPIETKLSISATKKIGACLPVLTVSQNTTTTGYRSSSSVSLINTQFLVSATLDSGSEVNVMPRRIFAKMGLPIDNSVSWRINAFNSEQERLWLLSYHPDF